MADEEKRRFERPEEYGNTPGRGGGQYAPGAGARASEELAEETEQHRKLGRVKGGAEEPSGRPTEVEEGARTDSGPGRAKAETEVSDEEFRKAVHELQEGE